MNNGAMICGVDLRGVLCYFFFMLASPALMAPRSEAKQFGRFCIVSLSNRFVSIIMFCFSFALCKVFREFYGFYLVVQEFTIVYSPPPFFVKVLWNICAL